MAGQRAATSGPASEDVARAAKARALWWLAPLGGLGGAVAAGLLLHSSVECRPDEPCIAARPAPREVQELLDSTVLPDPWHVRRAVDDSLAKVMFTAGYSVRMVVGPSGAGKSEAVRAAIAGRPGAIVVRVRPGEEVWDAVATAIGLEDPIYLERTLESASKRHRAEQGVPRDWVPTIVVEIDDQLSAREVETVLWRLRELSCKKGLCAAIVTISDVRGATAAGSICMYLDRKAVSDYSLEEVEQLAEALRRRGELHAAMAAPEQRLAFVRRHGTRAATVLVGLRRGKVDTAGRTLAMNLWHLDEATDEERSEMQQMLRLLAAQYEGAKRDAEASGGIVDIGAVRLKVELSYRIAEMLLKVPGSHGLRFERSHISFSSPETAECILELARGNSSRWSQSSKSMK